MAIHPLAATSFIATPIASDLKIAKPVGPTKPIVNTPPAKNDADGDLKADLASGENPYETIGSKINAKA